MVASGKVQSVLQPSKKPTGNAPAAKRPGLLADKDPVNVIADKLTYEIGMKLRWEPKTPRTSYLVIAIGTGPDAWKRYVELNLD